MMKLSSLVAAMMMMLSLPALAQDEPEVNCETAQTQVEMNFCAHADWEKADKELNTAYKEVRADLAKRDADLVAGEVKAAARLVDAQRAWITYRDAHCEVESFSARGGSMQSMLYSMCLAVLTRNRTTELKSLTAEN